MNRDGGEIVAHSISTGEETVVHRGDSDARYVEPGYLVFMIGEWLFGIGFDPGASRSSGSPRELIEGVTRAEARSGAKFGIADDGTLADATSGASDVVIVRNFVDETARHEAGLRFETTIGRTTPRP